MRELTGSEVVFSLRTESEDQPVRGNAMASGDPEFDRSIEDEILARLQAGDEWAWCGVVVEATWAAPSGQVWHGVDSLWCCSYRDEREFRAGGYYPDMERAALADLNRTLATMVQDLDSLRGPACT